MNRESTENQVIAHRQGPDLAWLAEQYVLGELAPNDCDAFEARLAVDQSAREAVASATALFSAAFAASHEIAATQPAVCVPGGRHGKARALGLTTWGSASWGLAASAAVLVLAAFAVWQVGAPSSETPATLAGAWSATRDSLDDDFEGDMIVLQDSQIPLAEELDVPDWLMTAVSLRQQEAGEGERPSLPPDSSEGA